MRLSRISDFTEFYFLGSIRNSQSLRRPGLLFHCLFKAIIGTYLAPQDIKTLNIMKMNRFLSFAMFFFIALKCIGQPIATVDKKTKEFYIPPGLKTEYRIFGYQFANSGTRKMICFSSHEGDVRANYNECPLGSYFDTEKLSREDKIIYLGPAGSFAKMTYKPGRGKITIFYLPTSSFGMK